MLLLHLQKGVTVLDQVFEDLALVFELVLSEDHHIKVLTLRCEIGTELFNLRPVLLNPRLYRIQLTLLLREDLSRRLGLNVESLFPFFFFKCLSLSYETF